MNVPLALVTAYRSAAPAALRVSVAPLVSVAPGLGLCLTVSVAALGLRTLEQRVFGHTWLETLVLAILVGTGVRSLWTPSAAWRPGVNFGAKAVLEVAVVLLGASVTAATLASVGWALLVGVVAIVFASIAIGFGLGRLFGLPRRMAMLVACGNSICGNSAIAAIAPVIGAEGKDVAAAIAFTALLGVATVLGLPLIGAALHLDPIHFGVLSGLTVYAVPQVLAAAAPAGPVAVQMGTLVKLLRVLMLGPVCLFSALLAWRWAADAPSTGGQSACRPSLFKLVPWFIVGFLLLAALRSVGLLPSTLLQPAALTSNALTVIAMGALGLCTDLRTVAKAGPRAAIAVTASLLALGALSLGLIGVL